MTSSDTSGRITRRQLLRLASMSAVGALAACAPPTATPAPKPAEPTQVQAAPTPTAAPPTPAPKEPITIRFWNVWGAAREELMNQIAARFQDQNPGITIQNLVQPFERREENLLTALASNDPPEVLMAARAELLKFADDGLITPITEYVKAASLDLSRFYEAEIGNMYWKGELYSMPMPTGGGITCLVLTNNDMFAAAGKDPVVPATWADLEAVAKEFTEVDAKGIVKIGATVGTDGGAFLAWLYCNNGTIYSEDLRTVTFGSEEGVQTLDWMVRFTNDVNGGVQNVTDFFAGPGEATEAQPWYNDKQLCNFANVSIFFHMQTYKPDMAWDIGPRPYNSANAQAKSRGLAGEAFAWSYVVPKVLKPEVRDAAFKWVQKITYDDDGCWFMQQQARPSPLKACNQAQQYYDANIHWDKVLKTLETDVSVQILPVHARVRDIIGQGVQSAMFGEKTPAQALADAGKEAQAVVDEYWSAHS